MRCAESNLRGRKRSRSGAIAALLVALTLGPRLALAETVRLAVLERSALEHQPSSLRARLAAARAGISAAAVPRHPTLTANVKSELSPGGRLIRVVDVHGDEYRLIGSRAFGDPGALTPDFRYEAVLSLASRLYDFGRTEVAVKAAQAELQAVQQDEQAERSALVREVRAAYIAWLSAFETRQILQKNADDARSLRGIVEGRIDEGSLSEADATPVRHDEARANFELERSETELELSRLRLEQVVGVKLAQRAEPDVTLLDVRVPRPAALVVPEADALERRRDASFAQADAERASGRPMVSGALDVGLHGQAQTLFPVYRAGVSLTIPLLDGGLASASSEQAKSRAAELGARAADARSQASFERRRALLTLTRVEREIAAARQVEEAAKQGLKQAEERLALGNGAAESVARARLLRSAADLELLTVRVERVRAILAVADQVP